MNAIEALRKKIKDTDRDDIVGILAMMTTISERRLQELVDGAEPTEREMFELETHR